MFRRASSVRSRARRAQLAPGIALSTTLEAETDYTWDAGFTHQFTPHLADAQDNYFRIDRHYLDEGQFGFVPIDAPFNYVRGYGGRARKFA